MQIMSKRLRTVLMGAVIAVRISIECACLFRQRSRVRKLRLRLRQIAAEREKTAIFSTTSVSAPHYT